MAKYYREILHLLALGEESFEDELWRIVSIVFLLIFLIRKGTKSSDSVISKFLFEIYFLGY